MKKILFLAALAVAATFSACGGDNEPTTTDFAAKIAGTYNGSMVVNMTVSPTNPIAQIQDVDIKVVRTDENKANLLFNETITIVQMGIEMPLNVTCPITTSDNGDGKTTKFTGETIATFNPPINLPVVGELTQLPLTVSGTITEAGAATIKISGLSSMLIVDFTGTKK